MKPMNPIIYFTILNVAFSQIKPLGKEPPKP